MNSNFKLNISEISEYLNLLIEKVGIADYKNSVEIKITKNNLQYVIDKTVTLRCRKQSSTVYMLTETITSKTKN